MPRLQITPSQAIAKLLLEQRQSQKLTLREVEERLNRNYGKGALPFTTLNKIEKGIVDPGVIRLYRICRVYGILWEDLERVLSWEESERQRKKNK